MHVKIIAGVDEVGRGPLAGPVVAAAVILRENQVIPGLRDSKKLSENKRAYFYDNIIENALCVSIAQATVIEIDKLNILNASLLSMQRAIYGLAMEPDLVLVDGNQVPQTPYPTKAIVGGDDTELAISAASVIAKVTRDRMMINLGEQFSGYGFEKNKGYGTQQHMQSLRELGVTPHHRLSFSPVRRFIELHAEAKDPQQA